MLPAVIVPIVGIVIVLAFASRRHPAGADLPKPTEGEASPAAATPQETATPPPVTEPAEAAAPQTPAGPASPGEQLPADLMKKLGDVRTRAATIRLLDEQKDPRASDYLRAYCSDPDTAVRLNTVRALGNLGDPRSAVEISMRTGDSDPGVRFEVAVALGKLISESDPAEAAVSGLTESLKSEDLMTRLEAAKGLAKCRNDLGIKILVELLGHADPAVRKGAEDGLRGVGEAMIPALTSALERPGANEDTLRNVRLLAIFKRKEAAPSFINVLQAVCQEPRDSPRSKAQPPVRQACVDALMALGPEIIPVLDQKAVSARCKLGLKEAVAEVLKSFGSAAVAPISQRIISRQIFPEELELNLWIATLGEIGDPAAAPALSSALTKPVNDKEFYWRAVEEAARKIETKIGQKLALPPAPDPQA
jgi:HEAT repeat protein